MSVKTKNEVKDVEESEGENFAIIPPNGGWGWMVVICAFYCNIIVDGIQLTFGVFLDEIAKSFKTHISEISLAGSLMFGTHLFMGPICSGFVNAFGLRPVSILGALLCSFGIGITYFANNVVYLYLSYGIVGGMGLGIVYMNSLLVTGLYFTTLLPIAIGIVVCGTGVGTVIFSIMAHYALELTTWQMSFLMQSGLAASMGLAAVAFRPLKPVPVRLEIHSPTPSKVSLFIKKDVPVPVANISNNSLRSIHNAVWSSFLDWTAASQFQRKTPKCCSCCKCRKKRPRKEEDDKVLVLSLMKDGNPVGRTYVEKNAPEEASNTPPETHKEIFEKINLSSRKHKTCDLFKEAITSMVDCRLMKSCAFILFTLSGAIQLGSLLIVFIYEKDKCKHLGFDERESLYFVIALGASNVFWRLVLGGIALWPRINFRGLSTTGIVMGGVATMFTSISENIYWQYTFCFIFGLGMSSFAVFRILFLLDLISVEQLSTATGINLLFMGIVCIIFPPAFGKIMEFTHSYDIMFGLTGALMVIAGVMLIGLRKIRMREIRMREVRISNS